jgi:peptidoglycan/xylan/chitin deacetylase (PgdA/CDA1 family)
MTRLATEKRWLDEPGGSGTLCLTFDNMGSAAAIGLRQRARPGSLDVPPIGYAEILSLLDREKVRATFFLEGWNCLHNPKTVQEVVERGHEIGVHGWVHEVFHKLDLYESERVLTDAWAAFRLLGIEPQGFRPPGGLLRQDQRELLVSLGCRYVSAVDWPKDTPEDDGHVVRARFDADGLIAVPWQWRWIDLFQYRDRPAPVLDGTGLRTLYCQYLDQAAATRSIMTAIFHPFVSGVSEERLAALEAVIAHARRLGMNIIGAGEVARLVEVSTTSVPTQAPIVGGRECISSTPPLPR